MVLACACLGATMNQMAAQGGGANKGSAAAQGWRSAALNEAAHDARQRLPTMGSKQTSILPVAGMREGGRRSFSKLGEADGGPLQEEVEMGGNSTSLTKKGPRPSHIVSDAI